MRCAKPGGPEQCGVRVGFSGHCSPESAKFRCQQRLNQRIVSGLNNSKAGKKKHRSHHRGFCTALSLRQAGSRRVCLPLHPPWSTIRYDQELLKTLSCPTLLLHSPCSNWIQHQWTLLPPSHTPTKTSHHYLSSQKNHSRTRHTRSGPTRQLLPASG